MSRQISTARQLVRVSARKYASQSKAYEVVVCGGGAAGSAIAAKFTRRLGAGKVAVIEPAKTHYYQPMFTMIGGGVKQFEQCSRPTKDVLPSKADWIQNAVSKFEPENNAVVTSDGAVVKYKFLVIALGIAVRFENIPGVPEALQHDPSVCSNFSPLTVQKTYKAFQKFRGGTALFTFPNTPVKCAGAPQKVMYMFEDYLRRNNLRNGADIQFHSALGALFSSKHYADILWGICKQRNINVNLRSCLVEVNHQNKQAVFQNLDNNQRRTVQYDFLHVTPPMQPHAVLKTGDKLTDAAGFVNVNKQTLQHAVYSNVFAVGDCTNLPTSKTAAAVAGQVGVLETQLASVMKNGATLSAPLYDGYTSCPLVTSNRTCVLAEFDYSTQPLETFPKLFQQSKENPLMFVLKAHLMPALYWNGLVKGYWNGTRAWRKLLHLGMSK